MPHPHPARISPTWKYFLIYWSVWIVFMLFFCYFSKLGAYNASVKVKGVVTFMLTGSSTPGRYGGNGGGKYPEFSFVYNDSIYSSSSRHIYAKTQNVGDTVTVIFDPVKPDKATIYSILTYWFPLPTLLVSAIIAAFIFSIPLVWNQYALFKKEFAAKSRR